MQWGRAVCPFPRSLKKTHSRPPSHLALSRVSRWWLEGGHVRHLFTIYMLGQRPQQQLALSRPAFDDVHYYMYMVGKRVLVKRRST